MEAQFLTPEIVARRGTFSSAWVCAVNLSLLGLVGGLCCVGFGLRKSQHLMAPPSMPVAFFRLLNVILSSEPKRSCDIETI